MDEQSFLDQVNTNKGIIYKICHTYCRSSADIEDLAQEIIYQLWKSRSRFNPQYSFTTWMYRVALNTALADYKKYSRLDSRTTLQPDLPEIADPAGTDDSPALQVLQQFLWQLKELDRALMLLYLEEKSYQEMADILGISSSNVGTRLSRIKDQLKQYFKKHKTNL